MNNLRELSAAILMYARDYDGCAPGVGHPWADGSWAGGWPRNDYVLWQAMIEPYLTSRSAFDCPAASSDAVWQPYPDYDGLRLGGISLPAGWEGTTFSYGINVLLQMSTKVPAASDIDGDYVRFDYPNTWFNWANMAQGPGLGMDPSTGWGGRNLSLLKQPGRVILVADTNSPAEVCYQKVNTTQFCGNQTPTCSFDDPVAQDWSNAARHNGGNNWAFADGHVKWVAANRFTCYHVENLFDLTASDVEILSGNTLQKAHGVDQLN